MLHDLLPPLKPPALSALEFLRVLTPYVFLQTLARGRSVLEVGVGSGHGCWFLRQAGATRVLAVDIDPAKVGHVSRLFADDQGVMGVVGDAQNLAFRRRTFDVVTCFEVIEHVTKPHRLLAGVQRLVVPGGLALVSTPNRRLRLLPFQPPWNPEHRREYTRRSFERAVARHFESFAILGIYGDAESHAFYRRLWRQDPTRVYAGLLARSVRRLVPERVRSSLRRRLRNDAGPTVNGGSTQASRVLPGVESWPFWVAREGEGMPLCFVAVCGSSSAVKKGLHIIDTMAGVARR